MENHQNKKNSDTVQKVFDPYEENNLYYEINKNKYIANAFIDKGKLGPVASFHIYKTQDLVTIKKISNAYENPLKVKNVLKQLSILSFVNHPNIIKLLDIIIPEKDDSQNIYFIEEYMSSNLERLIMVDSNTFDYGKIDKFIPCIIYKILQGLHYLHSCRIIHRDIKSSNILIDEKGNIKICGFGNAINFDDYENTFRGEINDFITEKGNLAYQAPEILSSKKKNKNDYNEKIDLWGVGCIMAELYTKIIPFFPPLKNMKIKWISQLNGIFKKLGKPSKQEIQQFASKERIKDIFKFHSFQKMEKKELFPNIDDENAIDLIEKLLCINPKERISLKEAINHPYFDILKEIKDEKDFTDSDEIFVNEYEKEIEEMEKRNAYSSEQINFYKYQILSKKQNFQNSKK